jgi:hypothetical protein
MITITKQPYLCALSKNSIDFVVTTDLQYDTATVFPSLELSFLAVPAIGSSYVLTFTNPESGKTETIDFVAVDGTNANNYKELWQIPGTGFSGSLADLRTIVFEKSRQRKALNAFYNIELPIIEFGGSVKKFTLTAKQAISQLVIDYTTNQASTYISEVNSVAYHQPGVRDGYALNASLFLESNYNSGKFNFVTTIDLVLDENSVAHVDFGKYIDAEIEASWNEYPVPFEQELGYIAPNLRRYYVVFSENYSNNSIPFETKSETLLAHWGGVSSDDFYNSEPIAAQNTSGKWLTWWPSGKRILKEQSDWLGWMNGAEAVTFNVICTIKTNLGTKTKIVHENVNLQAFETFVFNTGFDANSLDAELEAGEVASSWEFGLGFQCETCDSIVVTYQLEGDEAVTVEVENVGDEYTTEEFKILKDGTYWIVQAIEETPVVGCDCIKLNYDGGTITPTFLDIFNGKKRYQFTHLGATYQIYWDTFTTDWRIVRTLPTLASFGELLVSTADCPFGTYTLISEGYEIFGFIEIVQCAEFVTYATLSEDSLCPFGVFTIEEDSIFSAFSVLPTNTCDLTNGSSPEPFRYYFEKACLTKQVVYFNSFGVPESFILSAEFQQNITTSQELATRTESYALNNLLPQNYIFDAKNVISYQAETMMLSNLEAERLMPLVNSTITFLLEKGNFIPVIINAGTTAIYKVNSFLQKIQLDLVRANESDRVSYFEVLPDFEPFYFNGISGINLKKNNLKITDFGSIKAYIEGEEVAEFEWNGAYYLITPAFSTEGLITFVLTCEINGEEKIVRKQYNYKWERIDWIFYAEPDNLLFRFSLNNAFPDENFRIDWGDGITEDLTTGDGLTAYNHTYLSEGKYFIRVFKASFIYTYDLVFFDKINFFDFNSFQFLRNIRFEFGSAGKYYFNGIKDLENVEIKRTTIEFLNLGFHRNLEVLTLDECVIDSDTLDALLLELWTFRKGYLNAIAVTFATLGYSPSAFATSIVDGTGVYAGDGLTDYSITVTFS